jgi:hypothetical protein
MRSSMIPHPAIETDRLHLRIVRPGDEVFLAELYADTTVMEYVHDGANSPEDAMLHARIDIQLSETRFYTGMWLVQPCDNVAPLGWVCFSKLSGRGPRSGDDLQLGYQFAPKH